jgi:hypothetical protein
MGRADQELIFCFSGEDSHNALLKEVRDTGIKRLSNFYAALTGECRIHVEHLYMFRTQGTQACSGYKRPNAL